MLSDSKILIVDDDLDLASNLRDILSEEGLKVWLADSARAALELCQENTFDLGMIDIRLPDMMGIDLIAELTAMNPRAEYLIVTGYASVDTAIAAVGQKGIIGYHTKPLNMAYVVPFIKQVLERQRAERSARESDRLYRLLAENVADVIWTTDMSLHLTYVSPSVVDLLGYTPEETMAMMVEKMLTPASVEIYKQAAISSQDIMGDIVRKGPMASHRIELELVRKGGSPVWTEILISLLFGPGGHPNGLLGVTRDIAERRRAAEELRALSHRLVQVQEDERRAIARELHDEIGQSLTVLNILLSRASQLASGDVASVLAEARPVVSELISGIRELSLNLRPSMLDDLGLLPTLLWYFQRYTNQTQIHVNFEHVGLQRSFPPDISTAAYRIVQEALTNVARHAHTGEVDVYAWVSNGVLSIKIEDRGNGFDSSSLGVGHSSGLSGMQERARLLGGELTVESSSGKGTCLIAELPYPETATKAKKTRKRTALS
ncbi:MAG: response regulator [Dehalococcoidales bacterium]|nr:response regulator [Dehalococcoidales bacterium]